MEERSCLRVLSRDALIINCIIRSFAQESYILLLLLNYLMRNPHYATIFVILRCYGQLVLSFGSFKTPRVSRISFILIRSYSQWTRTRAEESR